MRRRTQGGCRCQVQRATVLHVQPVIVVGIERAGDFQPPPQDLVCRDLRHRRVAGDVRRAGARHGAACPDKAAVDLDVSTAAEIDAPQHEQAVATDGRITGQCDVAAGQRKRAGAGQIDIDRHLVAEVVVRRQVQ